MQSVRKKWPTDFSFSELISPKVSRYRYRPIIISDSFTVRYLYLPPFRPSWLRALNLESYRCVIFLNWFRGSYRYGCRSQIILNQLGNVFRALGMKARSFLLRACSYHSQDSALLEVTLLNMCISSITRLWPLEKMDRFITSRGLFGEERVSNAQAWLCRFTWTFLAPAMMQEIGTQWGEFGCWGSRRVGRSYGAEWHPSNRGPLKTTFDMATLSFTTGGCPSYTVYSFQRSPGTVFFRGKGNPREVKK